MRLYLDDDMASALLARLLAAAGHDVEVPEAAGMSGSDDPVQLTRAIRETRVLLTGNHDDYAALHDLVMQAGVATAKGPRINSLTRLQAAEDLVMGELTLESLARRVESLETALAAKEPNRPSRDWRNVIGMFRDSEFMRQVDEECHRMREAERDAARRGELPE